tara:strand:- start:1203 stop:1394 length:192 start_codon:yes stop_codon:yes gene_type:complete
MTSELLFNRSFLRIIFCATTVFFFLGTIASAKETVSNPAVELSEVKEKKKSASDDDDDNEEGC